MIDPHLLKMRDVCVERYLRPEPGLLLRWVVAQLRGALPDATVAPFNVHAVGIARKWKDGRKLRTPCIQVAVLRKMKENDVARHGGAVIETEIEGVPIDVVESGPLVIEEQAARGGNRTATRSVRPLRPGCSISHGNVVFGTLGGICKSTLAGDQGATYALSCRHVLAGFSTPQPRKPIFQPGGASSGQGRIADGFTRFI
ncbi:MAG TPA: hypothetical protein VFN64_14990, partial [Burkholderiaceae bacterium]|nr:hypothetical protein [Burkholderiaceae bacterium]